MLTSKETIDELGAKNQMKKYNQQERNDGEVLNHLTDAEGDFSNCIPRTPVDPIIDCLKEELDNYNFDVLEDYPKQNFIDSFRRLKMEIQLKGGTHLPKHL